MTTLIATLSEYLEDMGGLDAPIRPDPVDNQVEDSIEVRRTMPLSLSYDQRLIDGATAARFLNEVIDLLEVSGRLLLAP